MKTVLLKRTFAAIATVAALYVAAPATAFTQADDGTSGYASVNGLEMYYEIHGAGNDGAPLVLLHGAFGTIDGFSELLPAFAETRKVIAVEQQAHGHTADIDRPLTIAQMADDTAALLQELGVEEADVFGYSMGAGVALQLAVEYPELVHKLVVASVFYNLDGVYPEVMAGIEKLSPEAFAGSPMEQAYKRVAPNPEDWGTLIGKVKEMNTNFQEWPDAAIESIAAPTFVLIGDADIVRPEHAVEMFRLLGGGGPVSFGELPEDRLAILPGTTHISMMMRADWLTSMITEFLDAPVPEAK